MDEWRDGNEEGGFCPDGCAQVGRAAGAGEEAKQQLGGEEREYFHSHQFHSDFVLYNETASRRLPPLADRPPVKPDVNSNYLKVSRSNSRLTSTLKKLLPRRKTSKASTNNSEVNLTGIYNNNKYIIKVNNSEAGKEVAEKAGGWVGMGGRDGGEGVRGARVNRNKSFLLGSAGNKVKRSNSVLPGFLGRRQLQQDNRTVVEVGGGGGGGLQQFPWAHHQEKAKESGGNNDNHKNNNNRYVTSMPTPFWGEGSAGRWRDRQFAKCGVRLLNLPLAICSLLPALSNTGSGRWPLTWGLFCPKSPTSFQAARSSARNNPAGDGWWWCEW